MTNVKQADGRPGRGRPRRFESGGPGMPRLIPARDGSLGGTLFEDDVMLPEQYFARLRHRADYPGEQRLLLAVLEDAVHCFRTNLLARTPRRRHLFEEAEEWLFADTCEALVTFAYVCDVFDLDQDSIRAGLQRWRDDQRAKQGARTAPIRAVAREREEESLPLLGHAVGA